MENKLVAVPNFHATSPVYQQVDVEAENAASVVEIESGKKYVPQTPESFTYDDDGNLLTDGRWEYTWDGENRLIAMQHVANAVPPDARLKLEFLYDWRGRRIRKTVAPWNVSTSNYNPPVKTTKFVYDGWNLVAEVVNGTVERRYIWGPDLSGTFEGAGGVGGLLMVLPTAENPQMVFSDANGNVTTLADIKTGEVTAEYEYGPFGEVVRSTGEMADENPVRFSSKYEDAETGNLYYGFRYFTTRTGRWVSRDPLLEKSSNANMIPLPKTSLSSFLDYGFNRNNAITNTDFLGLAEQCNCGPEAGHAVRKALVDMQTSFLSQSFAGKLRSCNPLAWIGRWDFSWGPQHRCEGKGPCENTYKINGNCHNKWAINYAGFGLIGKLCGEDLSVMLGLPAAWKIGKSPFQGSPYEFNTELVKFLGAGYYGHDLSVPEPEEYSECADCKVGPDTLNSIQIDWPY